MRLNHYHRCPECGLEVYCTDGECDIERTGAKNYGQEKVCRECQAFPTIDLRSITRRADRYQTIVRLHHDHFRSKTWIVLGQASLTTSRRSEHDLWILDAFLPEGVTDPEHDSARALRIPIIGVKLSDVSYGQVSLTGVISCHDAEEFRVPPVGYDPMRSSGAQICTYYPACKEKPHIVVPEKCYLPEHKKDVYSVVVGRKVTITFGAPGKPWKS